MPRNLQMLIAQQAEALDLRLNANETANLDRAFRHMEAEIQRIKYPALTHAQCIPLDTTIPEWAQTVHYKVLDQTGRLEPIANFADDLPASDVVLFEEEIGVKSFGGSYRYSVEDLMRASAPGSVPLDSQRAMANRDVAEEGTDRVAWLGYPDLKIRGFLTNEMVEVLTPAVHDTDTTWEAKIANDTEGENDGRRSVLRDVTTLLGAPEIDTNKVHKTTDVLFAPVLYQLLQDTPFSSLSETTMLAWLRGNYPGVTFGSEVRLAEVAGGPMVVAYKKAPTVLQHKLVMPYRTFAPQARNLAFIVNGMMRTAGTHIYRTKAVKYLKGAA